MGALCAAILSGKGGEAFEKTEEILAEGKSVGMLLKDVMNFLNACAVAKMCRDADKILALPKDMFALVADTAKGTDGHMLLRATEIFLQGRKMIFAIPCRRASYSKLPF